MALADTAKLAVQLNLEGNFNAGVTSAEAKLAGLNATTSRGVGATGVLSGAMGKLGGVASGVGGALSHAGGQIKGLLTGPLGMIGLAGGFLTLGGAITTSVHKIEEFGAGLEKVQMLTGETALASGALLIQFQKFGLGADDVTRIAGFAEKTLGKLNEAAIKGQPGVTKLTELSAKYGLQLIDSSGKVADFSSVLGQLATYYDSGASASDKAYLASQIFGRGYTQMLPILNEGSAGLRQAAKDAADLGLGSQDTVAQLAKFHDQMHALENQTNLLQLSIGTALLPTLLELSTAATKFVTDHRSDIVAFFKNAVAAGKEVGGVLLSVGKSILDAWNMIPPGFRDLIVKGVAADRTFKFLFGFDPIQAIGKSLIGGLGSSFLGRGSPGNPMYVTGLGGGGGVGGGGFLGKVAVLGAVALAAGTIIELKGILDAQTKQNQQAEGDLTKQTTAYTQAPGTALGDLQTSLQGIKDYTASLTSGSKSLSPEGIAYSLNIDHVRDTIDAQKAALEKAIAAKSRTTTETNPGKARDDLNFLPDKNDAREGNRILRQTGQTTASKIDYAKVDISRKVDTTTSAIQTSQSAIVSAILSLAKAMHVTIGVANVTTKAALKEAYGPGTTVNRGGMVAS